jgi:hypothetical protein
MTEQIIDELFYSEAWEKKIYTHIYKYFYI